MTPNAFISRRQASNVHHAIRMATELGPKLNYMLAINIGTVECDVYSLFRTLRCRFLNIFLRNKCRIENPTYIWVLECPVPDNSPHIHFLMHIPDRSKFFLEKELISWLNSKLSFNRGKSSIRIEPIQNIVGAKRYILKGMDPIFAPEFKILHVYQGIIEGKRIGYTNNIGPSAKRKLSESGKYHYRKSVWFSTL